MTPNRKHVLDLDDFSKSEIDNLLHSATVMKEVLNRDIKKVPSLRGKVILTLFLEASTRTRVSFEEAGKLLSADVINISGSGSSAEKGESLLNTALTLQAMRADLIIIRHPLSGAPYFVARHLDHTSVVNAGDGRHAHPTQGLLDLMTIYEKIGSLNDKKVLIVGDVLHSRVARSNIHGLQAAGAEIIISGPPTLVPLWLQSNDKDSPITYQPNLDVAIQGTDVVMALRLQTERQASGMLPSIREYTRRWQVTENRMVSANNSAIIMHPGPLNEGIEISSSLAHSEVAAINEQVTNGVALRMALLYQLLTFNSESTEELAI
ncbi:MAG: aspartate carbamoyltransferase [Chloroflexi bacterium]|nr:aspartate carbamoyltransferase [Chloroflexota bacterium]